MSFFAREVIWLKLLAQPDGCWKLMKLIARGLGKEKLTRDRSVSIMHLDSCISFLNTAISDPIALSRPGAPVQNTRLTQPQHVSSLLSPACFVTK